MFARMIARIIVMAFLFAILGLIVGLVGKYALDMTVFENPFWAVAIGLGVGAIVGAFVSMRIESARKAKGRA